MSIAPSPAHHATEAVSQAEFRSAMARLSSAVNVVTTDGPAGRHGMIASAVCSVSDTPPTLLVCINRTARGNRLLRENGAFAVSVLAYDQLDLSTTICDASDPQARFAEADRWHGLATGAPVVHDALACFDCRVDQIVESGTHTIFIGSVEAIRTGAARQALVYFDRGYRSVPA